MIGARFIFVGNGSYQNKGCEAIVRGTVEIMRNAFGDCRFVNANFDVMNPPYLPTESDLHIENKPMGQVVKWSPEWILHQALVRTMPNFAWDIYFRDLKSLMSDATAVLSVGGDNYTLDYGIPKTYIALDDFMARNGNPLIIWGASVGPFDADAVFAPFMHKHLNEKVRAIFVREERSLSYLKNHGFNENVYLAPDPAFVMKPESCGSQEIGFDQPDGAIGFNLSPLMSRFLSSDEEDGILEVGRGIVESMRSSFNRPIILIPHVTSPHSNDHALLSDIYSGMKSKAAIHILPPDLSAAQTKWVISKLDCLVAARTHATIAAFSSCVPTVSLAYSVKAYGINEMLFGHNDYVVPPEALNAEAIVSKVRLVLDQSDKIRSSLESCMQNIKNDAMAAGMVLKNVIEIGLNK